MDSGTPDVFKVVEFSEVLTNTGPESPPANRDWSSASGSDMGDRTLRLADSRLVRRR